MTVTLFHSDAAVCSCRVGLLVCLSELDGRKALTGGRSALSESLNSARSTERMRLCPRTQQCIGSSLCANAAAAAAVCSDVAVPSYLLTSAQLSANSGRSIVAFLTRQSRECGGSMSE